MELEKILVSISYVGSDADGHQLGAYDAGQAIVGLERVVSLTSHLVLNNEVIVQSPALKGAQIYALPPEVGSWKYTIAAVVSTSILTAGVAPKDSAIGHLMVSAYDYVVSEALGFHVDFDSTLGQQYDHLLEQQKIEKPLKQERFDSVIEKCEPALIQMHRPIVKSKTAKAARLYGQARDYEFGFNSNFSRESYEYIKETLTRDEEEIFCGHVTSFNANTLNGRIYVPDLQRNVIFSLDNEASDQASRVNIGENFLHTIEAGRQAEREICFRGQRRETKNGRLKKLYVHSVVDPDEDELG